MARLRANFMRSAWHSLYDSVCHGLMAPWRRLKRDIRNDQTIVDADAAAETAAGLAGADRVS